MSRKEKISVINENLMSCKKCGAIKNPRPFYFPEFNPDCRVMVITYKPSFQALYRPLFSTRFFRVLCLALFGANAGRNDFVELFNSGEIFWTHLQKCYSEETNEVAQRECAKFFIKREFELLKPNLQLVIVLGAVTKEFIEKQFFYECNRSNCKWLFAPLPKTGKEDEFIEVRKALAQIIQGVDPEAVPPNFKLTISNDIEDKVSKHAAFELKGIKRWMERVFSKDMLVEEDCDDKWFNSYVIPYFTSQALVSLACTYFEENIKMLLYNHGFTKEQLIYKKNINGKEINTYLCIQKLLRELTEKTGQKYYIKEKYHNVLKKIDDFKKLRNTIVHDGAFLDVPYQDLGTTNFFPKVKGGYNHIYLTYDNINEIISLMEQFVQMLDEIEKIGVS